MFNRVGPELSRMDDQKRGVRDTVPAYRCMCCASAWGLGKGRGRRFLRLFSANILAMAFGVQLQAAAELPSQRTDDYSGAPTNQWPSAGGDWDNTRFSALAHINTKNVEKLRGAWVSSKFDEGGTSRVTPIVKDGLMFVTAGRRVYALNAKTGERVWSYKAGRDAPEGDVASRGDTRKQTINSPNAAPNERGVAVGQGLVFVGLQDGHVIALKQKTGQFVWARQTGEDPPKVGQMAAVAPTYIRGIVFTGLSNGDSRLRGRLTALDARSGEVLWQLFSIPGPGEPGHDTWPSFNDTWKFGGGGVWTNSAVDQELGLVYFTTGNAVPATGGDWRPGNNLYTCSVLAVDIQTGKLRWYYQLIHHDVFDADAGTPVILYDARVGARIRKALAVLRADGYLFQLDRATGKPLFPVKEQPVPQLKSQNTSPTQPFPVGGESILMSCEDWRKEKIPAGFALGCMWTPPSTPPPSEDPQNVLAPFPTVRLHPMTYSPDTGYFYAQGLSSLAWFRRAHDPYFFPVFGKVPGLKSYGELAAIDSRTGRIVWRSRTTVSFRSGGLLATAGGLVFRSSIDGNLEAYDASTGNALWKFQTGMSGPHGSPVSYEIDGEQYIALPVATQVRAFRLGGSIPSAAPSPIRSNADDEFWGPVIDTNQIEAISSQEVSSRHFIDEYAFNPYRARVKVGANVLFINNGVMRHEFAALDNSWGTGPLSPAQEAWIRFDKPGKHTYICKDHPWSYGQILVEGDALPQNHQTESAEGVQSVAGGFTEQAIRGKHEYNRNCSACHGEDLSGRATAPELSGNTFLAHWRNETIGDLFDRIRTTMPQTLPGSLDRQTYLDILAYILRVNDLAYDKNVLKDDPEVLKEWISGSSPNAIPQRSTK